MVSVPLTLLPRGFSLMFPICSGFRAPSNSVVLCWFFYGVCYVFIPSLRLPRKAPNYRIKPVNAETFDQTRFPYLGIHTVILCQSYGMVKATAAGVERHGLSRPPHCLQVTCQMVRRRSRARFVDDVNRLIATKTSSEKRRERSCRSPLAKRLSG